MKMRTFGYAVVIAAFLAAIAVLIPWNRATWAQAVTTYTYTFEHPHRTKTEAMELIVARMTYLAQHTQNIDAKTVHSNLILFSELEHFGPMDEEVQQTALGLARFNMETHQHAPNIEERQRELSNLQRTDPAWLSLREATATEETWHWEVLREYASRQIPFSILFALVGFAGLIELWGFAKFLHVAVCSVSFLLSTAGGVVAQTVKKIQKKENTSQTLQMDARVSIFTSEGPPSPGLFLRVTNSNKKGLVDSISTLNPWTKAWSTEVAGGLWIPRTGKNKLLAEGVWTNTSNGTARIGAGIQLYRSGIRGLLAIPGLRWERAVHGPPGHSFSIDSNPNLKLGKGWSLAPFAGIRKTQSKPWSWYFALGLRFTPDKGKHQFEVAPMTDSAGLYRTRMRMIGTMAY